MVTLYQESSFHSIPVRFVQDISLLCNFISLHTYPLTETIATSTNLPGIYFGLQKASKDMC